MATYQSGRGYSGGQGARNSDEVLLGDIIRQSKSGYRTQSLWRGRSNFLQTAGNEDRSIMPNTTVPRGTARGGPLAQAAWRTTKDWTKMQLGVPDISLADWGGEDGYKIRDVISAVKNSKTNFRFDQPIGPTQGPLQPPPGFPAPVGPRAGPGPGPGPLPNPTVLPKPTAVPPHPVPGSTTVGNMNVFPGSTRTRTPDSNSPPRVNLNLNDPRALGGVNAAVKAGQAVGNVLGGSGVGSKLVRGAVAAATVGAVRPSVTKAAGQVIGAGAQAGAKAAAKSNNAPL